MGLNIGNQVGESKTLRNRAIMNKNKHLFDIRMHMHTDMLNTELITTV